MGFFSIICICCGQREVVEADTEEEAKIKFDCVVHNSGCQSEVKVAPHNVEVPMFGNNGSKKNDGRVLN